MGFVPDPLTADGGLLFGEDKIVPTAPANYVPCKGEWCFADGNLFLPLDPRAPEDGDFPVVSTRLAINRAWPWLVPSGMTVAGPCIQPHDWAQPVATRTVILDTVLDADATDEEKALPGYVANPGIRLDTQTRPTGQPFTDTDGAAIIWHFPLYRNSIPITATVNGRRYRVTKKGDGAREVGEEFVASGAGSGTAKVTLAALPHPLLRTGQTRYTFPETTKVGTDVASDGAAFLPGEVGKFTSGALQTCGYKYGYLLGAASWEVAVKIGRATATWAKAAKTLTLECNTEGATIYYSTDGTAPTTVYTAPISITETKTVRWYARKANTDATPVALMLDSDEWQTAITYEGTTAPDNFETVYFSALPAAPGALENAEIDAALLFHSRPAYYISTGGTGAGLLPGSPSNATDIIGVMSGGAIISAGLALGPRTISISVSGAYVGMTAGRVQFATAGAIPSGALVQYATGPYVGGEISATWATYSAPFLIDAPGRIHFKLTTASGEKRSRVFVQPWFLGPASLNAAWDATAKTVTLTYSPAPVEPEDLSLLYSTDGSAPSILYDGPFALAGEDPLTVKVQAVHAAREYKDFATASNSVDLTAIDPDATPDFDEDHDLNLVATPGTLTHRQRGDVVWASEGTYTPPATKSWGTAQAITIRGGYNSAFTERDVRGRKALFVGGWPTAFVLPSGGLADGLWFGPDEWLTGSTATEDIYTIPQLFSGAAYNCHIDLEETFPGGAAAKITNVTVPGLLVGSWVNGGIRLHLDTGAGATGVDGAGGTVSVGGKGGGSVLNITLGSSPGVVTTQGVSADVVITAGRGGDGGAGAAVSETAPGAFCQTSGGAAGVSEAYFAAGDLRGSGTVSVFAYGGGDGGVAGSATAVDTSGYMGAEATSSGGGGGDARAQLALGAGTFTTLCESSHAGDGGAAGAVSATPFGYYSSIGGNGGTTYATATIAVSDPATIAVYSGDGGSGGSGSSAAGLGRETSAEANFVLAIDRPEADITVESGNGGTGRALSAGNTNATAAVSSTNVFAPEINIAVDCGSAGTNGYARATCFWTYAPLNFGDATLAITEAAPYGHGNPIRANAATTGIGWYSGTPNGDGAPLAGYETPQGAGVALGRYFE